MSKIVEDIQLASAWVSKALNSSGYKVDFTPSSLWEIDRFFDEHSQNGSAKAGGLLSKDLGSRIFAIGSYVGEVIRRHKGGEWQGDDSDPNVEVNVALHLGAEDAIWPIQRVAKRFQNGTEDSIATYGHALGLPVGTRPGAKQESVAEKFATAVFDEAGDASFAISIRLDQCSCQFFWGSRVNCSDLFHQVLEASGETRRNK